MNFFGLIFQLGSQKETQLFMQFWFLLPYFPFLSLPSSCRLFVIPRGLQPTAVREGTCSTSFIEDTSIVESGGPLPKQKLMELSTAWLAFCWFFPLLTLADVFATQIIIKHLNYLWNFILWRQRNSKHEQKFPHPAE